ncbi:MAG TPA: ABC transporter ATP-binding protein [Symbiobacteriaceae bacterium]|nr:ABC transporter ATP-binding protein [Symbiobacteriaceae bacterium]
MSPILHVTNVTKTFRIGSSSQPVLKGINLAVEAGELVALAGPSGSGKTTLLNLIGCLDSPDGGSTVIDGVDVSELKPVHLAKVRREKLGFVFQNFNLLPVLTALENVEYPLTLRKGVGARQRRERAAKALEAVGLAEHMHKRPAELSGGQQQRVAIARALVTTPKLILADEPTAHLDQEAGRSILALMQRLCKEQQVTFLFTTHDPEMMEAASRLVRLRDGAIQE